MKRLLLLFLALNIWLHSAVVFYQGEKTVSYRADLSMNIRPSDSKPFRILVTSFPDTSDCLYLEQTIKNYEINYNTKSGLRTNYTDAFSNRVTEIMFRPKKHKGRYQSFSYEVSLEVELSSHVFEMESDHRFPEKDPAYGPYVMQFLEESKGISFQGKNTERKAIEICYDLKRSVSAVNRLSLWVKHNIAEVSSGSEEIEDDLTASLHGEDTALFNAESVLENGRGSFAGRLNLLAAMIRSLRIPVRLVSGISIDRMVKVSHGDRDIRHYTPKDDYYWLEIYLHGPGWLPVNLRESSLVLFPSYIRKRCGAACSDLLEFDHRDKRILPDMFFEKSGESTVEAFKTLKIVPLSPGIHFLPPINTDSTIKDLNISVRPITEKKTKTNVLGTGENRLGYNTIEDLKLSSRLTGTPFAQHIRLDRQAVLEKVSLAIYKLVDNGGSIRVLICSETNGLPGAVLYTSRKLPVSDMKYLARYSWYDFKLPSTDTPPVMKPGDYWIIPEISGKSVIHWAFITGHLYGDDDDAMKYSVGETGDLLNGDFALELHFKEE